MDPQISRGTSRQTTRAYLWGYPAVANSFVDMSALPPSDRPAYDDFATPQQMHADCVQVGRNLRLDRISKAAVEGPPSLHFEDYPREVPKRGEVAISDAAARLAAALHLHLD